MQRERKFNTAGPSIAGDHYMIDPLKRIDLFEIETLIDDKRYFVLHAPRQTGKTTYLLTLMKHLNTQGKYACVYANIEAAQALRGDVERGMMTVVTQIAEQADIHIQETRFKGWAQEALREAGAAGALTVALARWAREAGKPVVLMLDEVDALVGDTLISLLRQIRAGYGQRPDAFPQSVILCGVRDVRDYRIHTGHNEIITGGSAFNIKTESLRLGSFRADEVATLYAQHTQDTGQTFVPEIFAEMWEDTYGQPWLVNALGYELTWKDKEARNRTLPLTLERYKAARERLIQSRATHLDQLSDKLKEDRVHRVIAPMLESDSGSPDFQEADVDYVLDLGLVRREINGQITLANRIYREIIPRTLSWGSQMSLTEQRAWYVGADHRLDMLKLLTAFQQFFREHSAAWIERFDYKEAGPQLLLQAFLQRVINGGGRIGREYGLGRKRTDLFIEWPLDPQQSYTGPMQRIVIELKLLRGNLEKILADGLTQTADYADACGADEAHLILFDRRPEITWDAKIWHRTETHRGRVLQLWGA